MFLGRIQGADNDIATEVDVSAVGLGNVVKLVSDQLRLCRGR
jgi:hypothetical protein